MLSIHRTIKTVCNTNTIRFLLPLYLGGNTMTLHQYITDKTAAVSKTELIKTLGYGNAAKGLETLDTFLQAKDTDEWLHSGHYDFKYNSRTFLTALGKALDIPDEEIECAIAEHNEKQKKFNTMTQPYIFVNTNFKRKSEPIFTLALLEGYRRLNLDKQFFLDKSDTEIFEIVRDLIQNHYHELKGELALWGKIYNYVYHHTDGQIFVFNTEGNIIQNAEPNETKAELRIGNQYI